VSRPSDSAGPRPPGEPDLARLVGMKLGNYRLERVIGRGRMGVVYQATDEALLRPTAIKVMAWDPVEARGHDPVQWFLSEARAVARINDQRVVQIYGAARQGDWCYIAMELVPGRSAETLLEEGGRLRPELATDILLQAASALAAAHRSGVIHRDVKPGNLLLGPGGITKLSDFGMALGTHGARGGPARVRAGTPFYTAPEVWRGGGATAASDVYSLGATYFHLLTGRPPFPGLDLAAVEQAHLTVPPPDPRELVPGLPASCTALVRRALAKVPAERQPSAQELMRDGKRVLEELGVAEPAARRSAPSIAATPAAPAAATSAPAGAAPGGPARRGPNPNPITSDGDAPARGGAMSKLEAVAKLPGVRSAVLGDLQGALVESAGEVDAEVAAAEGGFVAGTLAEAGEALGLGALRRVVLTGQARGALLLVRGRSVLGLRVDPVRALAGVEKAVDGSFEERT